MTVPTIATPGQPRLSRVQRARRALARLLRESRSVSRESLRTMIAILKAQQEATLDGILVVDSTGNVLSYNRRFLEIWRIPESVAATADDNELLGYAAEAVQDWDNFIELVNYLYEHPDEVRTDDPVPLRDGRTLMRASVPISVDGKKIGRAWYFRDVTETVQSQKLEAALFRISQLSREAGTLETLYASIHQVVGELMNATNFYVAEYDRERDLLTFPYFVDEYDVAADLTNPGRGLTAYVLRTGEPLLATPVVFDRLVAEGEIESIGAPSVDWLGAPLKSGDVTWGAIVTQSYRESSRYTDKEQGIFVFVA